jgi:2-dehydropantoate 2-reductase
VRPRILVVGAGALGLLLAARLARSGAAVTVAARTADQARTLRAQGIRVDDGTSSWEVPVNAVPFPDPCPPADWTVVAVKSYHVEDLMQRWPPAYPSRTVVAVQNGLLAHRLLAEFFGADRVVAASTRLGATRLGPTTVRPAGDGPTIIGAMAPGGREAAARWAAVMTEAGMPAVETDDVQTALWTKAAINAVINPLATVLDLTNGELAASTQWRWLMEAVADEVEAVARAVGVALPQPLMDVVRETMRETAANRCSMLEDVSAGRPTELDAITGEVIRRAAEAHVAVPANTALYYLVQARIRYGPGPRASPEPSSPSDRIRGHNKGGSGCDWI